MAGKAAPGISVFQDLLTQHSDVLNFDLQLTAERIAACSHTEGTTSAPKLALHSHGNEAYTCWFAHRLYGFGEHAVKVNGFPLFHVAGAFVYRLSLLAIGATQVLPTLSGMRNAAFVKNYWKFCERERVNALVWCPTSLSPHHALAVAQGCVFLTPRCMQCEAAALWAEVAPHVYERPATPERVTIIQAMPTKAIGKIYKPALRLLATETKPAEMLFNVPQATVKGVEQGGTLKVQVMIATGHNALLERQLRTRLAAIAANIAFIFSREKLNT